MAKLSEADYDQLLSFIGNIHACFSEERFPALAVAELARLVSADHVIWNTIRTAIPEVRTVAWPSLPHDERRTPLFAEHMHGHPVVKHMVETGDSSTRAISDFWSERRFHESTIYEELYREMGVEDQMGFWLPESDPQMVGIAFTRSTRSFTERERVLLECARPHIAQAWRNARKVTRMLREGEAALPSARGESAYPPNAAWTASQGLTPREVSVLLELEKGLSNKAIAAALFISPLTVRKHLENIYQKLGVSCRTAALRAARKGNGDRAQ